MNSSTIVPSVEVTANCAVIRGKAWAGCPAFVTMVGRTLVFELGLAMGCTPAETASTVVVSTPRAGVVLVRTTDSLAPGDVIHIWRRSRRGYRQVAGGVVTVVVLDAPDYALVDVAPGDDAVAVGDRGTKDSPMFYWHHDPPSD